MSTDARSTSRDRLRVMPCQKEENERSEVKSTKTIRMSLSREQPPARVERAQQEQDYAASRSGHAGCRLFLFRCKRECGLFSPRFAANDSPVEDCDQYFLRKKGTKKSCGRRPRLTADQKAANNTSRRLRSVLFAEKRYKTPATSSRLSLYF